MLKLLTSFAVSSFLLCAPALADTPSDAPITAVKVSLVVKQGADVRTHELVISDRGCGTVKEKAVTYEDEIRVCSRPTANGLVIDTEWFTRTGPSEYRTHSETILRKGGTSEIGRTGGIRLAVKLS
jgi:hypothetical protein